MKIYCLINLFDISKPVFVETETKYMPELSTEIFKVFTFPVSSYNTSPKIELTLTFSISKSDSKLKISFPGTGNSLKLFERF